MLTAVKEDTHDYRSAPPDYDGLWKNIIQEFMAFLRPICTRTLILTKASTLKVQSFSRIF
ncbi:MULTISPECIES: hypothetical protein [Gracilibacillus]|uniref:hypothetical protein n=1 Tax=Gracilibacillus TaxID=74385 RepID=UPI0008248E25|nr:MULTISPECIES: hypothetical protein [Gracilibacillus]